MLTDIEELRAAWGALASQRSEKGFLTIALGHSGGRFRGGISYPEEAEMLLVGFDVETPPAKKDMPEGKGFIVHIETKEVLAGYNFWICLSRQSGASLDLFSQMAIDIVASLTAVEKKSELWLLNVMLGRISAWQDFMRRPLVHSLTAEEELGLFGELLVLECALLEGKSASDVVQAWVGPSGGLQDFQTEKIGLEVKSTQSAHGFPVQIGSLEQLNPFSGRAVLLAALRLCEQSTGRTLPELVDEVRLLLSKVPSSLAHFERTLLFSGYTDSEIDQFQRRRVLVESRVFEIDDKFPCLTRSNTRPEIRSASYEIDVDLVPAQALPLPVALSHYGVF